MFLNLVFLQRDLAHLSVANKGACDLIDALPRSDSNDIAGRYEAGSLFYLSLVAQAKMVSYLLQIKSHTPSGKYFCGPDDRDQEPRLTLHHSSFESSMTVIRSPALKKSSLKKTNKQKKTFKMFFVFFTQNFCIFHIKHRVDQAGLTSEAYFTSRSSFSMALKRYRAR